MTIHDINKNPTKNNITTNKNSKPKPIRKGKEKGHEKLETKSLKIHVSA